ncbi:hypothetical protein HWB76_gp004 [Streptomyces phage Blueeyedbeauty]|uniref:Uncharacterized protein n=1 Tax=Streptomyces phage Blueeyedbeauty TaxID=2250336 RepID=A0A345L1K0_9CAUD|nr:hypothetical protein HWB76_gp004 [Streptomyces phage Blueeyedbeauty]AXH49152.1 hypothetical protein SEA_BLUEEYEDBEAUTY_4 [Streptomyces phage Blueeyedbeauty]
MATQKDVLERLGTKEELLYWARKNNIAVEEIDGGFLLDEWKVSLEEERIVSVERRLDEPQSL